ALAAGGGSLVGRVQRLVAPAQVGPCQRWLAGLVVAALALAIGGGAGLASRTERFEARTHLPPSVVGADAGRTAPDTVLRYPGPVRSLAERWDWASAQAQQLGA